ncbi:uridine 5'-monophosphate synthase-like [Haliotis rufescens]|uniref:uridine 5'-monophosphate synthase-like n=1 Tax=Haliotis rufescens TaxID=6454 RepID=UPI001EB0214D|nr:uridine 5'-monophosphate synthase-like [Haliotis rufescens]
MAAPMNNMRMSLEDLIIRLYDVQAVKFGTFKLKSGIESPVYIDLRVIVSYPEILVRVSEYLWDASQNCQNNFKSLCGVPYTALPLATCIATKHHMPMLIRRKEAKDYGTKRMIEGHYEPGERCLVVEDVVTSGSSVLETAQALKTADIDVRDAVVLLDREQGGAQMLKSEGIHLHSVCTLSKMLDVLQTSERLSGPDIERVREFIAENKFNAMSGIKRNGSGDTHCSHKKAKKVHNYADRASLCTNPISKQLLQIMEAKKSNLAVSADLTSCGEVLELVNRVGPHVCLVKTHVDILEDFTPEFTKRLTELAQKHNFLIFEDRKFADIGSTVLSQYTGGMYRIADWANITNAHSVPGEGVIQGLKQAGLSKNRACVLVAEMSSTGNLAKGDYSSATVKMAEEHSDFVIGFICQSRLTSDPSLLHMTPGVQLTEGQDSLGQNYITPTEVITNRQSDIIIVGRGITKATDPAEAARQYQEAGYRAYLAQFE